jgi:hypothetical protein
LVSSLKAPSPFDSKGEIFPELHEQSIDKGQKTKMGSKSFHKKSDRFLLINFLALIHSFGAWQMA